MSPVDDGEQPDISYPEIAPGARVMLCSGADGFAQSGTIEKIDGDIVTVDFYDWLHEYHAADVKLEFYHFAFELVVRQGTGRILEQYGVF